VPNLSKKDVLCSLGCKAACYFSAETKLKSRLLKIEPNLTEINNIEMQETGFTSSIVVAKLRSQSKTAYCVKLTVQYPHVKETVLGVTGV
jgi:hypothetical protein